jgi:hypothetical protein
VKNQRASGKSRCRRSEMIIVMRDVYQVQGGNGWKRSLRILTNEIIAANNKILTKRSSNCSSTNCHIVLPSSVGSSEMRKKDKKF